MKRLLVLVLTATLVVMVSCGKKEVKKVSESSKIATEAFALAETIKNSYLKKDFEAIEKNTTREGFRVISRSIKIFDSAELSFNPVWVEIDDNESRLNVSWKGTWKKAGKITEERGMAIFVLKGAPLKVDNILRANPFAQPVH